MNKEKYKEHEFGVAAPEGYLLESSEDYWRNSTNYSKSETKQGKKRVACET